MTSAPVRGLRPMPVFRGRTVKTPKPRNSIRSPCASDLLHAFEDGFHRHLGLGFGDASLGDNFVDQIQFDHKWLRKVRSRATPTSAGTSILSDFDLSAVSLGSSRDLRADGRILVKPRPIVNQQPHSVR